MFASDVWPSYYSKAKGCRVLDREDGEFIDIGALLIKVNAPGWDHGSDQFPKRGHNNAPPQTGAQIPLSQVF